MNDIPLSVLFGALAGLIVLSGFFSSSETGMMSINRYRLKHATKKGDSDAKRVAELLSRPDRLIGVILIGNNLVNNFAAALTTMIAIRLYGEGAVWAASTLLTLVVLIFAEVTPKTIAALHPEKVAYPASWILRPLLILLYPFVLLVNSISNALAKLAGVNPDQEHKQDHLNPEELRTVVDEAGDLIPDQHQGMLLNVLDLEKATIEDIMIPRNDVVGLNLEEDISVLMQQIRNSDYTRLPVYEGDINNIIGTLHLRHVSRFLHGDDSTVTHEAIRRFSKQPYFVPEGTPLSTQLLNFQKEKRRMAIVVDEYGEVQGIVTLEDLLEEIVGDFTTNSAEENNEYITALDSDWYVIDGSASIRDINKHLNWELPAEGPRTLNGVALEYLQSIPDGIVGFDMKGYRLEVISLDGKRIASAKVRRFP
ncbi:HlyC/CorC family transporter [Marinibactrum halimedae]|uniref:Magnesium and cobalt efflux protein CorC n=1 Tax=Marinibactrum halimedae TaxID=1444977 RepID=A0AA37T450_9GAMM|nr:HlyC/CorC family transporter [Marinibactrum halimedae]MCD9460062.1 HlyC/CorC family transporter [Marinibactrum halimedae]GLS26460.1 hemolysin [Marinibactrum halimedae]